ncbi:unnamed protein product [Trichogramma brassicae]|uniref:Phospholipase B1, membrane-associated n=1 Tax=Trichogramma brassicae TaxID=86971 RepID=A0A6H5I643_9HYME|nr:unnamed protein product [Trichogramma brassicae]
MLVYVNMSFMWKLKLYKMLHIISRRLSVLKKKELISTPHVPLPTQLSATVSMRVKRCSGSVKSPKKYSILKVTKAKTMTETPMKAIKTTRTKAKKTSKTTAKNTKKTMRTSEATTMITTTWIVIKCAPVRTKRALEAIVTSAQTTLVQLDQHPLGDDASEYGRRIASLVRDGVEGAIVRVAAGVGITRLATVEQREVAYRWTSEVFAGRPRVCEAEHRLPTVTSSEQHQSILRPHVDLPSEKNDHLLDVARGRTGKNEELLTHARNLKRVQDYISAPFPCDVSYGRSPKVPKTVHELRPGDIDVIGAMGDSLTAGNGVFASNILHVLMENRGVVALGGGQGNWRKYLTLPNILKEFNPNLIGFATSDAFTYEKASEFNVAEGGAMSRDIPYMAQALINRMKSDPRVDLKKHWKMVSIMIGANDFCTDMCYLPKASDTLHNHKKDLLQALRLLKSELPRTFVSVIPPPHLQLLVDMTGRSAFCEITVDFECSCLLGLTFRDRRQAYYDIMAHYRRRLRAHTAWKVQHVPQVQQIAMRCAHCIPYIPISRFVRAPKQAAYAAACDCTRRAVERLGGGRYIAVLSKSRVRRKEAASRRAERTFPLRSSQRQVSQIRSDIHTHMHAFWVHSHVLQHLYPFIYIKNITQAATAKSIYIDISGIRISASVCVCVCVSVYDYRARETRKSMLNFRLKLPLGDSFFFLYICAIQQHPLYICSRTYTYTFV